MKKKSQARSVKLFVLWAISFFGILSFFFYWHIQKKEIYLQEKYIQYFRGYEAVINSFRDRAKMIFEILSSETELAEYLYRAKVASDSIEVARIRDELKLKMDKIYPFLTKHSFRQLHFHTDQNRSFLRMHRPKKFGDDLTGFRKTVEAANKRKIFIGGFEEGRIFNGYRFIFPLNYQKQHVGTVEISISMSSIGKILKEIGYKEWILLLNRTVYEKKIFKTERKNYEICLYDKNKVYDKDVVSSDFWTLIAKFTKSDRNSLLSAFEKFVSSADTGTGEEYVMISIPIINFSNKRVGDFIAIGKDKGAAILKQNFYNGTLLVVALFAFLAFLLKKYIEYKRELEEMSNFLPVCSSCFSIREKDADPFVQSSWLPPDKYFHKHEQIDFSHGLCPKCLKELYGEELGDL